MQLKIWSTNTIYEPNHKRANPVIHMETAVRLFTWNMKWSYLILNSVNFRHSHLTRISKLKIRSLTFLHLFYQTNIAQSLISLSRLFHESNHSGYSSTWRGLQPVQHRLVCWCVEDAGALARWSNNRLFVSWYSTRYYSVGGTMRCWNQITDCKKFLEESSVE